MGADRRGADFERSASFLHQIIASNFIASLVPLARETKANWVAVPGIVVAQDAIEVVSYDRANSFAERRLESPDDTLDLAIIGARLSLRDIYRDTGLL